MYIIKQTPEDFIVKEISSLATKESGQYTICLLRKRDYTTMRAIERVTTCLGKQLKDIGFAGTKDKKAVTEQIISIKNAKKGRIGNIKLKDINLKFLGYSDEPVSLGDLEGNEFTITVRNIEKEPKKLTNTLNYFGEQRFSKNNAQVGKSIIKGNFKEAVRLMLTNRGDYEKDVGKYLTKNPTDFIGALKTIPKKILRMYVHSYQSFLWNITAERYLKLENPAETKIPIVGFGTELEDDSIGTIIKGLLKEENVDFRDFVIRPIPELSSEGDSRDLLVKVENLKIGKVEDDELNQGKKKVTLKFRLPKGSYATVVIKHLFQ